MAATVLIRIREETRNRIAKLAEADHSSLGEVVDLAIRKIERERFWKNYNEGYKRLKADPNAWAEYQDELRLWDSTLMDGLSDYPYDDNDESR